MRRQTRPVHEFPSFARYLHQVFDFRTATAGLTDARQNPEISPQAVFYAAFYGFVFRLPSFQTSGDFMTGSYQMMSSEEMTSIQEGYKINIVLLDNHGFGSIGSLSESLGCPSVVPEETNTAEQIRRDCPNGLLYHPAVTRHDLFPLLGHIRPGRKTAPPATVWPDLAPASGATKSISFRN